MSIFFFIGGGEKVNTRQQQSSEFILENYYYNNFLSIDTLRSEYPNIIFTQIAPQIFHVEVPSGFEEEGARLNSNVNFLIRSVAYGLSAQGALEASNISFFHNYPLGEVRGRGILIGFVDTGIQYTNNLFRQADGTTRIAGILDQTIVSDTSPYGTRYTSEQINEALRATDPYSVVPSRDTNGHGTYLAGVAAGYDQSGGEAYTGGAPDAQILMVKLKEAPPITRDYFLIPDGAVAYAEDGIIAGITYLIETSIQQRKPLVICIGLENSYGAHNGTNVLERYLENLSVAQNLIIVIAAGNEGNAGHHYQGQLQSGGREQIEINVAENDRGFSMYLWTTLPDKVTISIRSPIGQVIDKIPILFDRDQTYHFNLERTVLTVRYTYPDPQTGGEKIDIRLQDPTPGIWTLTVIAEDIVSGIYHVWLPISAFIAANTRFLKPDPQVTVTLPGTAEYTISVGAYDYVDNSIYVASGRGPNSVGIIKPDFIAPGVNVIGPSLTGGFTTYVGTSTAAAITSSAAALLLDWAIIQDNLQYMNTRIARVIFMRGARRQVGVSYPNTTEGYGRLDLQASIARI